MPPGAVVGTGSVRRRAQLAALRPDLAFGPLRGNIETRLRKREENGYDAIVVAFAALERLGLTEYVERRARSRRSCCRRSRKAPSRVECRVDDERTLARLEAIDDGDAHVCVDAERAFLAELGGGCTLPCGALARSNGSR